MLDGGIRDRVLERGCRDRERADVFAAADGLGGNAVLGELPDQRTGQNEIEESVDLVDERALGSLLPGRPPKDGEDLDRGEQRSVPVGELRRGGGRRRLGVRRGLTERVGQMQGDDPKGSPWAG